MGKGIDEWLHLTKCCLMEELSIVMKGTEILYDFLDFKTMALVLEIGKCLWVKFFGGQAYTLISTSINIHFSGNKAMPEPVENISFFNCFVSYYCSLNLTSKENKITAFSSPENSYRVTIRSKMN